MPAGTPRDCDRLLGECGASGSVDDVLTLHGSGCYAVRLFAVRRPEARGPSSEQPNGEQPICAAFKPSAVAGSAAPAATLALKVRGGGPTGTVLATVARHIAAPTGGDAWYVFPLSPPLAVTPGAPYAIELSDGIPRFEWVASTGDASAGCAERELAGGEAFADGAPLDGDFPFATFAP